MFEAEEMPPKGKKKRRGGGRRGGGGRDGRSRSGLNLTLEDAEHALIHGAAIVEALAHLRRSFQHLQ